VSLGIAFKGPEGVVLAADSRVTLMAQIQAVQPNLPMSTPPPVILAPSTYDNATKLLKVKGQDYVGAVTFGLGAIGMQAPRTVHSFLPEFEAQLHSKSAKRMPVMEFAEKLGEFFLGQWKALMPASASAQEQIVFFVGGIDPDAPYGRVFELHIPGAPKPKEWFAKAGEFGAIWGGQRELVDRLVQGYDPRLFDILAQEIKLSPQDDQKLRARLRELTLAIPYQFLPLQDSIDLSIFLIRTTITLQKWQIGVRGVGGAIDVASITRTGGFQAVQQKSIRGET
jgi:hypothetical protein